MEIPIVKEELIGYLNKLADQILDLCHPERDDPDRVVKDINDDLPGEDTAVAHGQPVGYTDYSVQIDSVFGNLPIEHQLTLTSLALENARTEIGKLKGGTPSPRKWGGAEKVSVLRASEGTVEELPVDTSFHDAEDGLFS